MSRPDGTPRKLLNMSKLRALGWKAHTSLAIGLERSYADFLPGMGGIKSESHHQRPATMANVGDELRWQADF